MIEQHIERLLKGVEPTDALIVRIVRGWANDMAVTPKEGQITRIGLQDDMTFTGSAAALNRSWGTIEGVLAIEGHRPRSMGAWCV